ncbi:hypothetical protein HanXRQr2_Chr16g0763111 [Helianthus annuus]|uniref:Uncharacterized protein n=1 Tax=Helianthus annuus TaxID=4232 RepID=A0A251SLA3_HELAN|nr:hypothetical protein HanXRQr2_Chr16g0763111 [Helianthus annuus]KAJ0822369.1 hypothetical protein HanPSC8_Chr16g0731161 [Helianthus annuus]
MWNHVKMDGSVEVQRAKKTQSSKRTQIRIRKVNLLLDAAHPDRAHTTLTLIRFRFKLFLLNGSKRPFV